jgi:hypothetical protein
VRFAERVILNQENSINTGREFRSNQCLIRNLTFYSEEHKLNSQRNRKGSAKMTITASQGTRPIPIDVAKSTIQKIENRNPAIRAAVDYLVARNPRPTPEEKRNESILKVYQDNYIFGREVDWKLDDL